MLGTNLMFQGKLESAKIKLNVAYIRGIKMFGPFDAYPLRCLMLLTMIVETTGDIDRANELYYLLGTTLALPSDGEGEYSDDSVSESNHFGDSSDREITAQTLPTTGSPPASSPL